MAQTQKGLGKFWYDKHGNFTVWQRPNPLLIVWFAAVVLTILLPNGSLEHLVADVAGLAILVWAVLELGWGASYFRRLLGLCVLLLVVVSHL